MAKKSEKMAPSSKELKSSDQGSAGKASKGNSKAGKGKGGKKGAPAGKKATRARTAPVGVDIGGKEKGEPRHLTTTQYNAMWLEYLKSQSITACAKAAGVRYVTAKKYITGDANLDAGHVPIRERYIKAMEEAQADQEQTLVEWQSEQVKDLKRLIKLHMAEAALIQKHTSRRMDLLHEAEKKDPMALPELMVTLDRLTGSLDKIMRLTEHMMGGVDMTVEHKTRGRFATWTEEEKMAYAERGILPEHER